MNGWFFSDITTPNETVTGVFVVVETTTKENTPMNPDQDCILCREPVTNPVCHECLADAIAQWVAEEAPERIDDFWRETRALDGAPGVQCVHCKHPVGVCTYCYTRTVFNWLRDGELQLSFVEYFNFDFYRQRPYADGMRIE